ncbi:MAG: neutral/alkaline non-lysosomal ceramidase N-terminal domain-containing protein [Candidatus Hydrogenedentes bacterium]|nr:neutral/alkaline non-lysosomal ceramidase N-terminal domain-containing protein [Candidatus Hydrogenedentota bacterium]
MSGYHAGFASIDITPPLGTPIGGNFRGDYASRGVHMPLQANAMVVHHGETAAALISADLLVVTEAMAADIRGEVEQLTNIPCAHVMVAATHTHSGPATLELVEGSRASNDVIAELSRRIASAAAEANNNLKRAQLTIARFDEPRLSFNRRLRMKDGSTRMNWESLNLDDIDGPLGPTDPQGFALTARHDGRIAGMLVNFALHPAVLAGDNWDFSPDWPGYLREALHRYAGSRAPIVYVNGAQGNINHLDAWDPRQGRGVKEAQRIGYVLANDVASALAAESELDGPLRIASDLVMLHKRRVAPEAVSAAQTRLAARGARAVAGQEDGIPEWYFDRELVEHAARQNEKVVAETQVIRIGEAVLAGLPGEFFTEFGLQLKQESPARFTLPVGLANGALGYIPTPEAIVQGGYEAQTWRYNQFEPDSGEHIVRSTLNLARSIYS